MMVVPRPNHCYPSARRGETGSRRDAGPAPGTVLSLRGARRVSGGLRPFAPRDPSQHRACLNATHGRGSHRGPQASPPGIYKDLHRPARRELPRRGTDPERSIQSAKNQSLPPFAEPGCRKLPILPERVLAFRTCLATDTKHHRDFSPVDTHRKGRSREFAT